MAPPAYTLAQQSLPQGSGRPSPGDRFRALTGWAGLTTAILLIVLVCAVALIARNRVRTTAALRSRKPAPTSARLDAWAESAKRLELEPPDRGTEGRA